MDDKHFDKLLNDMKEDYERMPEYADKQSIVDEIYQEKKPGIWRRLGPPAAGVAVLMIFAIMLFTMTDQSNEQADGHADDQVNDESNSDSNELMTFFLEGKEYFRQSIGMKNVDDFYRVQRAREMVNYYEDKDSPDAIESGEQSISSILYTPERAMSRIQNSHGSDDVGKILDIKFMIEGLREFQVDFQEVLAGRISKSELTVEEQKDIVTFQDNLQAYPGPDAIKDLLRALNKNGYHILQRSDGQLKVKVDYTFMIEVVKNLNIAGASFESYLRLFVTEVDPDHPGIGNDYGLTWDEFDDVLLEIDAYYEKYKEDRQTQYFEYDLFPLTTIYLNDYLSAGVRVGEQIPIHAQEELRTFVETHKESSLWALVYDAVETYKANDWIRVDRKVTSEEVSEALGYQYVPSYEEDEDAEVIHEALLPLDETLQALYAAYQQEKNPELLRDVSAFDVMRLYMYAQDQGDFDTYYSMYDKTGILGDIEKDIVRKEAEEVADPEYGKLAAQIDYTVFYNQLPENETVFYFRSKDNEERGAFQMVKQDGVWKVPFMPMQ
ncbi:hypothetical protein [Lentibacillus saliphilus]|uniref:hypothetical protein n=1 Tax=Lentibacillus saliphilus TaxID=2737028 RepID=UPI001C2F1A47|nr:hypothetical protein [Lentibacillus saliphilus]